jgi:hypothetical protein
VLCAREVVALIGDAVPCVVVAGAGRLRGVAPEAGREAQTAEGGGLAGAEPAGGPHTVAGELALPCA